MAWWWPFSRKEVLPAPPPFGHAHLAAEFFNMVSTNQLQFLWLLKVDNCKKVLTGVDPSNDVKNRVKQFELDEDSNDPFDALPYLLRLKAVCADGRKYIVVAVLQNIFESKAEAERYADVVDKWKA